MSIAQLQERHRVTERSVAKSAVQILHQGLDLLARLSAEEYTTKVPLAFHATIGGHYRHCLEHFKLLLDGTKVKSINYELRERNEFIENDISISRQMTMDLIGRLEDLGDELLEQPVSVTCQTQYETTCLNTADSTIKREMMYGVAHAIHHYALIAVMASYLKIDLPEDFGVAPSTLNHRSSLPKNHQE